MTRLRDLGQAVHQHYTSQSDTGRVRNNERYGRTTGLDRLRELAEQIKQDPSIEALLSPQQKHQVAQLALTDANRARHTATDDDKP